MVITKYDDETYYCACNQPIATDYDELMKLEWACPNCGEKIRIKIKMQDNSERCVICKRADMLKNTIQYFIMLMRSIMRY